MRSIEFANFAYDDVQCRRTDRIAVRASSAAVLAVKKTADKSSGSGGVCMAVRYLAEDKRQRQLESGPDAHLPSYR